MKKALVTGSSGFIGKYLVSELESNGYKVLKCDIQSGDSTEALDILNQDMIQSILWDYMPDVIFNLAGQSNVGLSWKNPQQTVLLNTIGVINILESVKIVNPKIKVVVMGSSDEYGYQKESSIHITEKAPLLPMTPYAISKQSQELFAQLYVKSFGLDVRMIRQFNIGGAGQMKGFMLSDFASGIAEIEAGEKQYLDVGNLESARDYTHVKDACLAIRLIAEKGHKGEVYNICSGKAVSAKEILNKMIELAKVKIDVVQNDNRIRPNDTPIICGDYGKLSNHTGWMPKYTWEDIVVDVMEYWRIQVEKRQRRVR